jgi:cytochrome c biogenesis protein CcmG, thiol:disulfide interchange protein DsbE
MKKLIFLFVLLISAASHASDNTAPDFTLPGQNGTIQLSHLKGNVVYLDFWASWCQPCKKSFPWMNDIQHRYAGDGLKVVAVNLDKDRELADKFLSKVKADFEVAFDQEGEIASRYKLKGMPSSYLITRDGQVYASHIGFRDQDKDRLEQAIQSLLKK